MDDFMKYNHVSFYMQTAFNNI